MRSSNKLPIGVAIMLTMMFAGMYEVNALNSDALAAETKQEEPVDLETEQIETEIEGSAKQDAKKTEEVLQNSTISKISDETTIAEASSETKESQDKVGQEEKKSSDSRASAVSGGTLSADTETKEIENKKIETFTNEEKGNPENQTSKTKALAKGNAKSVEETPGEMLRKDDYNVEFTYDQLQYVLKGGTSVELREILSTVGLSGTPTNAVSSNDDLFTTDKVFGEWVVKSRKAFSTKETLSVTIADKVYDITVTDEQSWQCGDNLTGTLSDAGVLTISGTGAMYDYQSGEVAPWYDNKRDIKEVVIGNGVTSIGTHAFDGYSLIERVSISSDSSLKTIGAYAFDDCTGLESINIPYGVTSIGEHAFDYCTKLISIDIPDTVESIEERAFYNCQTLDSVRIPKLVTVIQSSCFEGCAGLKNVTLPENVSVIKSHGFDKCVSLESINLPDALTEIQTYAFTGTDKLERIYLPSSLTTIGYWGFWRSQARTNMHVYSDDTRDVFVGKFPDYNSGTNSNTFQPGTYAGFTFHFKYNIEYNGAEVPDDAPKAFYSDTGETITLPNPIVPSGQVFEGWYDNASLTGNRVTSFSTGGADGEKIFYAKWRSPQDVHFGGGVEDDALTKTYGDSPFTTALEDIVEGTATYSSSDPTVASIDSSIGEVTIYRASDTPITIMATIPATEHYIETTKSYALTVNKAGNPAYADPYEVDVALGGNTADLSQNLKDVPVGSAIAYSIADTPAPPEGCSIDENTGEFTSGSELGDAYVAVNIGETTNYESKTVNILVHVVEKALVDLDVSQTSITYGETLAPPSYVKPSPAGIETLIYEGTLRNGTAYGPTSEKPTKAGSYSVQVTYETSDKIYSGQADFSISPKNISGANVTLLGHLVYNGQEQTQAVQSIILDGNNITELCVISGNTAQNAGDYLLTAKIADETGNYTGSATKEFTVDKAQTEVGKVYADDLKNTLDPSDVVFHREDETVPGTFSLVEDKLLYGTHTYHWIFTPDDTINYETATGTIEITVINTKPDPKPKPEPIPTPKPEPEPEPKPVPDPTPEFKPEPEPEKVENQTQSSKSVKTGDGSNLSLWGALLASTPLGYYISKRRKKK